MDCSRPGFPVHRQLPQPSQTHVHRVGDAIQPSPPLPSPSPPAFNLPQHQGLSQWVSSSTPRLPARKPRQARPPVPASFSAERSVIIPQSLLGIIPVTHYKGTKAQWSAQQALEPMGGVPTVTGHQICHAGEAAERQRLGRSPQSSNTCLVSALPTSLHSEAGPKLLYSSPLSSALCKGGKLYLLHAWDSNPLHTGLSLPSGCVGVLPLLLCAWGGGTGKSHTNYNTLLRLKCPLSTFIHSHLATWYNHSPLI